VENNGESVVTRFTTVTCRLTIKGLGSAPSPTVMIIE